METNFMYGLSWTLDGGSGLPQSATLAVSNDKEKLIKMMHEYVTKDCAEVKREDYEDDKEYEEEYDVIEAYCAFEDIKPMGSTYLFDEDSHIVNNKTLRDFHIDITGSFCNEIRNGDNEPYKNKHFVFL